MRRNWGIKIMAFTVLVLFGGASIGIAAVPPPPVNQTLGTTDTQLNALSEAECRVCHDSGVPDRHHVLYGTDIPVGVCTDQGIDCQDDSECQLDTCDLGTNTCSNQPSIECTVNGDADCRDDYCIRDSQAPNAPSPPSGGYECLTCHTLVWDPVAMAYEFDEFRDCLQCHFSEFQPDHSDRTQEPTVHHRTATASLDLDCMACHGSLVNNFDDGHYIPTYDPSLVTPWAEGKPNPGPNGEGNCNFCHDAGVEGGIDILNNHDTHHETGLTGITLPSPPFGSTTSCFLCHPGFGPNHDAFDIRVCERCHGPESLHNIQVDSNGGGIVAGSEDAYFGHIGNNDDCFGCHGFTSTASTAPYSGPVVPYVQFADTSVMTAGTGADVTLTGVAFTNLIEGQELVSGVAVTAPDGSTTSMAAASVTESEMVVSVPGASTAGKYVLRAEKGPKVSNPSVIVVTPLVVVDSADCSGGTVSVRGSGFAGYVDATDSGTSITSVIGGATETGSVVSWTDTLIVADFSDCGDSVEVNSVFGAAAGGLNAAQDWGAASVVGAESGSATDIANSLVFLLIPVGAVLLWKRRQRRK
jgi:hypothetical protein